MFTHIVIGTNDIEASRRFYDAIFVTSGGSAGMVDHKGRLVYTRDGGRLMITKPIDGNPATWANGSTIGLVMPSSEAIDKWHAAGLANGGIAIESAPSIRQIGEKRMYLAYLRDPTGNKLCAQCVL